MFCETKDPEYSLGCEQFKQLLSAKDVFVWVLRSRHLVTVCLNCTASYFLTYMSICAVYILEILPEVTVFCIILCIIMRVSHTNIQLCRCVTEGADSCTLNDVSFLTQSEVAAVNSIGQFKIWDIRQQSAEPVRVFVP